MFDPSRIAVPRYFTPILRYYSLHKAASFRYQNGLRMLIWLFFLLVYSQSVQQPVEAQKDPSFDAWEIILYGMGLAYTIEGERSLSTEGPLVLILFRRPHICKDIFKVFIMPSSYTTRLTANIVR